MTLPLQGIRILDLSTFWSGPTTTMFMGLAGAEVIKIESIQRPDSCRFMTALPGESWWEKSAIWCTLNTDKYDLTLDLNSEKGIELFKRLVKVSNAVVENFTPRVMENFGLAYPVLKEIKNDIVMMSMPSWGTTGPWRDRVGFAFLFEQEGGWSYHTGYRELPVLTGGAPDLFIGQIGAFALLSALRHSQKTGKGQFIDLAQVEGCTSLLGVPTIDYCLNQRIWDREGNKDPDMAPHDCYRCKGDDVWVAIAVEGDQQWQALCRTIDQPELAERFPTVEKRKAQENHIDEILESWTKKHSAVEVMEILQGAGIASGILNSPVDITQDPNYKARGYFHRLTRKITGTQDSYIGIPIKFSKMQIVPKRPAPLLGEHNEYVLKGILGLSTEEIRALEKEQVIGNRPFGM